MESKEAKAQQWQFISQESKWTWRRLHADGGVESISARHFRDYAFAVNDAMNNGFHPKQDYWLIVTEIGTTHFRSGQKPAFVPRKDGEPFANLLKPIPLEENPDDGGKSPSSKSGTEQ
jgi:hypothetical protein